VLGISILDSLTAAQSFGSGYILYFFVVSIRNAFFQLRTPGGNSLYVKKKPAID
jgi:hypothetical protein